MVANVLISLQAPPQKGSPMGREEGRSENPLITNIRNQRGRSIRRDTKYTHTCQDNKNKKQNKNKPSSDTPHFSLPINS